MLNDLPRASRQVTIDQVRPIASVIAEPGVEARCVRISAVLEGIVKAYLVKLDERGLLKLFDDPFHIEMVEPGPAMLKEV